MNISRLAALAVIFMMVLSAFVAIPAYNASADHEITMTKNMTTIMMKIMEITMGTAFHHFQI